MQGTHHLTQLDKLQYLQLLDGAGNKLKPSPTELTRALDYAAEVWLELDLKKRTLRQSDVVGAFEHGSRSLFHVKAYPRKTPSVVVIVVVNGKKVEGHILIDLAADDAEPTLECPFFDFEGVPVASDIERIIPSLDADGRDPFAVLVRGDGTYMQTLCAEEGYYLEHQLVNTTAHYETPKPVTADEVIAAMLSYGFGNQEWLEMFDWRLQDLT